MSRVYKVCIHGHPKVGTMEIFAIKPLVESFDNLKEEIFTRKPDLKKREIRIYYTDAEDDRVSISNALDYAIFKESGFNRIFVAVTTDAVVQKPKANQPQSPVQLSVGAKGLQRPWNAALPTAARAHSDAPSPITIRQESGALPQVEHNRRSMPQAASVPAPLNTTLLNSFPNTNKHPNVICDGCDRDIIGFRYKCADCFDYDLCMVCESRMVHHHHVMIRIPNSRTLNVVQMKQLRQILGRYSEDDGKCATPLPKQQKWAQPETQCKDAKKPLMEKFEDGERALYDCVHTMRDATVLKRSVDKNGRVEYFISYVVDSNRYEKWVPEHHLFKRTPMNLKLWSQLEESQELRNRVQRRYSTQNYPGAFNMNNMPWAHPFGFPYDFMRPYNAFGYQAVPSSVEIPSPSTSGKQSNRATQVPPTNFLNQRIVSEKPNVGAATNPATAPGASEASAGRQNTQDGVLASFFNNLVSQSQAVQPPAASPAAMATTSDAEVSDQSSSDATDSCSDDSSRIEKTISPVAAARSRAVYFASQTFPSPAAKASESAAISPVPTADASKQPTPAVHEPKDDKKQSDEVVVVCTATPNAKDETKEKEKLEAEKDVEKAEASAATTEDAAGASAATTEDVAEQTIDLTKDISETEDDEDDAELMQELQKTMSSLKLKMRSIEIKAMDKKSPAKEQDSTTAPLRWTLLNADDTETDAVLTTDKANTGAIPKSSAIPTSVQLPKQVASHSDMEPIAKEPLAKEPSALTTIQLQTASPAPAASTPVENVVVVNRKPPVEVTAIESAELSRSLGMQVQSGASKPSSSFAEPRSSPIIPEKEKAAWETLSKPAKPIDKHIQQSLDAMVAMGFSNEGGWLTQLLESVKGDVSRAFDLLQPQK